MKRLMALLTVLVAFILPVKADIMPYYVNSINKEAIGVYQADFEVKVYEKPDVKSRLLLDITWGKDKVNEANEHLNSLFLAYIPLKDLAFIQVVDEDENWVQVIYNRHDNSKGWILKSDPYRFMLWRNFYNLYARKYGAYLLKGAPEDAVTLYSSTLEEAQSVDRLKYPVQKIKLTAVKGNFAMIMAYDIDKTPKIGYLRWRSDGGEIYLFPYFLSK